MNSQVTIGTRSSKLALWQTSYVKEQLLKLNPKIEVTVKEIKTKGDHITDVSLSKVEGKGFFTKEIEDALLRCEIDLAVHSLKDLPTQLPKGLKIGVVLKREKSHDVVIQKTEDKRQKAEGFKDLVSGAKIGTSSLRRVAQLKALRPDLEYLDLRGNLDTRIRKLEEGQYDAIVLAYAGVKRLELENKITEHLDPKVILPAACQGAMAIEVREDDKEIQKVIEKLNDNETCLCTTAERAFLETLQGGCQVPVGAYSEIKNGQITLHGVIASLDGRKSARGQRTEDSRQRRASPPAGSQNREEEIKKYRLLGKSLAEELLNKGGKEILDEIR